MIDFGFISTIQRGLTSSKVLLGCNNKTVIEGNIQVAIVRAKVYYAISNTINFKALTKLNNQVTVTILFPFEEYSFLNVN